MAINHYFTLDGIRSDSFNVGISSSTLYSSSERDITTEHLVGRNGDHLTDEGAFLNRSVVFDCWIAHTFKTDFNRFRNWLMAHTDNYYKLRDSQHPDYYFMARVVGPIEPQPLVRRRAGTFLVQFDVKPQWFRTDGEAYQSVSSSITNPTSFKCRPKLLITGKGTVTISGQTITVLSTCPTNQVYVDCETMDAYNGSTNLNNYVSLPLKAIELNEGSNAVSLSGCSLQIKPDWYDM